MCRSDLSRRPSISGRYGTSTQMVDVASLGDRPCWTVAGLVATYEPVVGGWSAQVPFVFVPGRSYSRWHVAIVDPYRRAHYRMVYDTLDQATNVAEGMVRARDA